MAYVRTQDESVPEGRPIRRRGSIMIPIFALIAAACAVYAFVLWGRVSTREASLTDVQQQLEQTSAELTRVKGQLAEANTRLADQQRRLEEGERTRADVETQNTTRIEELIRGRTDLEAQLSAAQQSANEVQGRYEGEATTLRSQLESLQTEMNQMREELTQARAQANGMEQQLALTKSEAEDLRTRLEEAQKMAAPPAKSRR